MYNAVIQLVTAFIGALGFALLFNVRRELLFASAFGGFLVWGVYLLAEQWLGGIFVSSVAAAAAATVYAEVLARVKRTPAVVFSIPALIPLVPGGSLYYTMSYAVRSEWDLVSLYGSNTFYCALGIASGMSIVLSIQFTMFQLEKRRNERNNRK